LLRADPFVPFAFVLTSGDRYTTTSPSMVVIEQTVIHVYRPRSDRRDILRLNQLAALEVLSANNESLGEQP
jgi:hypothetical protein